MASYRNDGEWKPRLAFEGEPYAVLVFTTQPTEAAFELHGESVCRFVARFLASRLESANDVDLESDASFLYVVLGHAPRENDEATQVGEGGALVEFGFGEAPAAPEEWESIPLRELLDRAVSWLSGGQPA